MGLQVVRLSQSWTERQARICSGTRCYGKFRVPSWSRVHVFGLKGVGEPGENPCRWREIRQTPHRETPGPGMEPTTLLVWGDRQTSCLVWASRFHNLTSTCLGKAAAHCCGLFCLVVALAFSPPGVFGVLQQTCRVYHGRLLGWKSLC